MNRKNFIVATTSAASLLAAGAVFAAEESEGWQSSAELGIVNTTGNSETSTVNAKFNSKKDGEEWRHSVALSALGTSTTDTATDIKTTSAEKYAFNGKSDYKFNEFDFLFISLDHEKDRFSGYEFETTVAVGYGRRLVNDDDLTFDVEIGPGSRRVEDATTGLTETDAIVRTGAKLNWKISETATLTEDLTADFSSEFDTIKSVTALTAKVNTSLALKVSLTIKNNSEVPVGTEKTDTETAVTLVYSF